MAHMTIQVHVSNYKEDEEDLLYGKVALGH